MAAGDEGAAGEAGGAQAALGSAAWGAREAGGAVASGRAGVATAAKDWGDWEWEEAGVRVRVGWGRGEEAVDVGWDWAVRGCKKSGRAPSLCFSSTTVEQQYV